MAEGVVMIFVGPDGRVVAEASDFGRDAPGGFTRAEAQARRCKRKLHRAIFDAYASPVLVDATDEYMRASAVLQLQRSGYCVHEILVDTAEPAIGEQQG